MSSYQDDIDISLFVQDINATYKVDLKDKIFVFVVNTMRFLMKLPHTKELDVLRYQLSKSATSVGANFEEAQSTSYREFVQKMRIALRESNESGYWLRLFKELELGSSQEVGKLYSECVEISKMLGTIVSKSQKKLNAMKS